MLGEVSKGAPKLKLGSAYGCDIFMVPPEKFWLCPAWSASVSNDEADHSVSLATDSIEVVLSDDTKVKLHKYSLVGLKKFHGKPCHLVRPTNVSDSKAFVKDNEKHRIDVCSIVKAVAPKDHNTSKEVAAKAKAAPKSKASSNALYSHILK